MAGGKDAVDLRLVNHSIIRISFNHSYIIQSFTTHSSIHREMGPANFLEIIDGFKVLTKCNKFMVKKKKKKKKMINQVAMTRRG